MRRHLCIARFERSIFAHLICFWRISQNIYFWIKKMYLSMHIITCSYTLVRRSICNPSYLLNLRMYFLFLFIKKTKKNSLKKSFIMYTLLTVMLITYNMHRSQIYDVLYIYICWNTWVKHIHPCMKFYFFFSSSFIFQYFNLFELGFLLHYAC